MNNMNKIFDERKYPSVIDNNLKILLLNKLQELISLSNYSYKVIDSINNQSLLKQDKYYISNYYRGVRYFLYFTKIDDIKYTILINKKSLAYENKTNIKNISKIKFVLIDFNFDDSFYKGTIIDGKIYNNYFYIQDIFYVMGNNITKLLLKEKLLMFNFIIKEYMQNKFFAFETIKIYDQSDINNIKLKDVDESIIFYPIFSGINIIYIKNTNVATNVIKCEDLNITNTSNDYINYLKVQKYHYETCKKNKVFWLHRTEIPDVYTLTVEKFGTKEGIAAILNLKTSHLCDNLIKNGLPYKFDCVYSNKFNKWIPIIPVN